MDLKEKLLTHLFCNLVHILQATLGQWSVLTPEEINIRKALTRIDTNPIVKFGLGPFESFDDHIYTSDPYVRAMESNSQRIQEKISQIKMAETMQTGLQIRQPKTSNKEGGKSRNEKVTPSDCKQIEGVEAKPPIIEHHTSKASKILDQELKHIKDQIKILRKLTRFVENLKKELDKSEEEEEEGSPTDESIRKLSRIFEMKKNSKNEYQRTNNDNIGYNNQYQIDGIFIINRLSEGGGGGGGGSDSKSKNSKEPDVEIFNELTAAKMKELLVKALNYLNDDAEGTVTNFSVNTNPPPPPPPPPPTTPPPPPPPTSSHEMEMNFLKEFERNLSRIFPNQRISIDKINQILKIIEFVDRYRGTVVSSDALSNEEIVLNPTRRGIKKRKNKRLDCSDDTKTNLDGLRANGKVLCDDGDDDLDLFKNEDLTKRFVVRRKKA